MRFVPVTIFDFLGPILYGCIPWYQKASQKYDGRINTSGIRWCFLTASYPHKLNDFGRLSTGHDWTKAMKRNIKRNPVGALDTTVIHASRCFHGSLLWGGVVAHLAVSRSPTY